MYIIFYYASPQNTPLFLTSMLLPTRLPLPALPCPVWLTWQIFIYLSQRSSDYAPTKASSQPKPPPHPGGGIDHPSLYTAYPSTGSLPSPDGSPLPELCRSGRRTRLSFSSLLSTDRAWHTETTVITAGLYRELTTHTPPCNWSHNPLTDVLLSFSFYR